MIKLTLQMKTIKPTKLKKSNYKLVNYFYNLLTEKCFFPPFRTREDKMHYHNSTTRHSL